MKKFVLKQTTNGIYHLYLDDPTNEGFIKVSQAKQAKFCKNTNYVILSGDEGKIKTLFGIQNNEIFQINLPEKSKIDFINGVCIFERDDQWYTMEFNQGLWNEYLLGKKYEAFLSTSAIIEYKCCLQWAYFLKDMQGKYELSHFINQTLVILGTYSQVHIFNGSIKPKILALCANECYDVFTPVSLEPYIGQAGEAFDTDDGVFVWSETRKKWVLYAHCKLYGKNAMFCCKLGSKYGEHIKLWRINDNDTTLIAQGRWCWTNGARSLCVEGVNYYILPNEMVDFDNPQPTLKKRIKDLFKIK